MLQTLIREVFGLLSTHWCRGDEELYIFSHVVTYSLLVVLLADTHINRPFGRLGFGVYVLYRGRPWKMRIVGEWFFCPSWNLLGLVFEKLSC